VSNQPRRQSNEASGPTRERPQAARNGPDGATGADGETRRGRRERDRARERARVRTTTPRQRGFLERHRGEILGLIAVAAIVFAGGFVVVQANAKAYSCATLTTPAPAATPLPNGSPALLGQVQSDMGRTHILPPESQRYAACPPASGNHYAPPGGPLTARYYGPDDATIPQGWIHNLEHGGLVVLYSCDQGACDDATQAALQDLFKNFPGSPICNIPRGTVGPVITRFEDMKAPIAALLWGRILFQAKLDTAQILEFFRTQAERKNPEPQCVQPTPTPAATAAPSVSPGASESAGPSVSPAASPEPSPSPS
jgi:hypothetical protein